jgi:D-alanyl-D-alanine carboxypeptidase (penicillin-binding protein 5/6)
MKANNSLMILFLTARDENTEFAMLRNLKKGASYINFLLTLTILMGSPQLIWGSDTMPHPFEVNASGAVLLDFKSGEFIYGQNSQKQIKPASLVKILTLFLVFDAVKSGQVRLEDNVLISKKAWRTRGSKMFIEVGTQVPLVELIKGIAVASGNDACVAVAEFLQGSEQAFVEKMNEKLRELGILHTHFRTVSGWPAPDQYTTAFDMALLARAYVRTHPEALHYHKLKEFTSEGISQLNRNRLLWRDPSIDGLKTGYISKAGYHLLATAQREDQRFIAVVMGAKNPRVREREALRLLNYGFRNYTSVMLFEKGKLLLQLPVWKGKAGQIGLTAAESGVVAVPISKEKEVSWHTETPEKLFAPVKKGQSIGQAIISYKKKVLRRIPLHADQEILQAGLVKRTLHTLALQGKAHKMRLISVLIFFAALIWFLLRTRWSRQNRRRRHRYLPAQKDLI